MPEIISCKSFYETLVFIGSSVIILFCEKLKLVCLFIFSNENVFANFLDLFNLLFVSDNNIFLHDVRDIVLTDR